MADISAILTTHTTERWPHFERAVKSLRETGVEIVGVFDDRHLAKRAEDIGVTAICSKSISGLAEARNVGADAASGDCYAFLDDDVRVLDGWAEGLRQHLDAGAIAVGGPAYPDWPDGGRPAWLAPRFDWLVGCGPYYDGVCEVRNTYGCNLAVAADAFDAIGGFDIGLGKRADLQQGEDADLGRRLQERFGEGMTYDPNVAVRHTVFDFQTDPGHLLRRAYWQGRSKAVMGIGDAETGFLRDVFGGLVDDGWVGGAGSLAFTAATGVGYLQGRLTG